VTAVTGALHLPNKPGDNSIGGVLRLPFSPDLPFHIAMDESLERIIR
jgi:hypothetical protein